MLASSVPEPDIEPDDQPTVSNTQEELGVIVTERAARTVAEGREKLDNNLQGFVINGTLEPRVIRLFFQLSHVHVQPLKTATISWLHKCQLESVKHK